jgi:hypothetical protein
MGRVNRTPTATAARGGKGSKKGLKETLAGGKAVVAAKKGTSTGVKSAPTKAPTKAPSKTPSKPATKTPSKPATKTTAKTPGNMRHAHAKKTPELSLASIKRSANRAGIATITKPVAERIRKQVIRACWLHLFRTADNFVCADSRNRNASSATVMRHHILKALRSLKFNVVGTTFARPLPKSAAKDPSKATHSVDAAIDKVLSKTQAGAGKNQAGSGKGADKKKSKATGAAADEQEPTPAKPSESPAEDEAEADDAVQEEREDSPDDQE